MRSSPDRCCSPARPLPACRGGSPDLTQRHDPRPRPPRRADHGDGRAMTSTRRELTIDDRPVAVRRVPRGTLDCRNHSRLAPRYPSRSHPPEPEAAETASRQAVVAGTLGFDPGVGVLQPVIVRVVGDVAREIAKPTSDLATLPSTVETEQLRAAPRGMKQVEQRPDRRRLARATRPQESVAVTG